MAGILAATDFIDTDAKGFGYVAAVIRVSLVKMNCLAHLDETRHCLECTHQITDQLRLL